MPDAPSQASKPSSGASLVAIGCALMVIAMGLRKEPLLSYSLFAAAILLCAMPAIQNLRSKG